MIGILARNWGWVVLRGVIAVIFGFLTLFNPAISILVLVMLFGAYSFIDGIFMLVSAVANRRGQPRWGVLFAGGLLGILIGAITFFMPALTAIGLLGLIALWAIAIGIAEIVAAIQLRKVITGEWMMVLAGVLAVAFGVTLVARPAAGALAVVVWIGIYAVITGALLIALGFRLRTWDRLHPAV